jgi:DNA modification methylase
MTALADVISGASNWHVEEGNCLSVLRSMPDECVQTCITSPPYFGLRDYGTEPQVWGGKPDCAHNWGDELPGEARGGSGTPTAKNNRGEGYGRGQARGSECRLCGAWRGHLGLEPTPDLFVAHLVEIFRVVRRVLRADGTLWLNLGDSYASGKGTCYNPGGGETSLGQNRKAAEAHPLDRGNKSTLAACGLKPKDLVGIPWMTAFALRADGWYLRSDIIWEKRNPMPESVVDRPTKSHEYVFLLAKTDRYYCDMEAIKERSTGQTGSAADFKRETKDHVIPNQSVSQHRLERTPRADSGFRNRRTVWTINTQPFSDAHFAVMPMGLAEPCVKAGTSEQGCCAECHAPQERVVEVEVGESEPCPKTQAAHEARGGVGVPVVRTVGWKPTCKCDTEKTRPCLVLDPFSGSGTTGVVARRLGRRFVGIDLKPEYVAMARKRLSSDQPLFDTVSA